MPMPNRAKAISDEVVIITRAELVKRERQAFLHGVERGKFEQQIEHSAKKSAFDTLPDDYEAPH